MAKYRKNHVSKSSIAKEAPVAIMNRDTAAAPVLQAADFKDIRYRGWFTYRGLRMMALLMMTLSQFSSLLLIVHFVTKAYGIGFLSDTTIRVMKVFTSAGQMTLPLVMIAYVGGIMNGQGNIRRMLLGFFLVAAFTYGVIMFVLFGVVQRMIDGLDVVLP